MKSFNVGDHISFTLTLGKDGKPQAVDLEAADAADAADAAGAVDESVDTWESWEAAQAPGAADTVEAAGAAGAAGQRYSGRVKQFRADKGFGFIECDELHQTYGRDTWVHHQQIGSFSVGDEVSFTMTLNKQGHPQAVDLEGAAKRRKI